MQHRKPVNTLFAVDVQNLWYGGREFLDGARVDYTALRRIAKGMFSCTDIKAIAYVVTDIEESNQPFKQFLSRIGYDIQDLKLSVGSTGSFENTNWNAGMIEHCDHLLKGEEEYANLIVASGDGAFASVFEKYSAQGVRVGVISFRDAFNRAIVDCADAIRFLTVKDCFQSRKRQS